MRVGNFAKRMISGATLAIMAATSTSVSAQNADNQQMDQSTFRQLLGLYHLATYGLGTNDKCEVLDAGQLAALTVFTKRLENDVPHQAREYVKKADARALAKERWPACHDRSAKPDLWADIDKSRLMADAIGSAMADMKTEPESCKIPGYGYGLNRFGWAYAVTNFQKEYADTPREKEYRGMRAYFATNLDNDCKQKQQSNFLLAPAAALRATEQTNLYLQKDNEGRKTVFTKIGSDIAGDDIVTKVGIYRSRTGVGSGMNRHQATVYRTLKRTDNPFLTIRLSGMGMSGTNGSVWLAHDGAWTADISEAKGLEFRTGSGQRIAFDLQSGATFFDKAKFTLPKASIDALAALDDAEELTMAATKDGTRWRSFKRLLDEPAFVTAGELREAVRWGKVPFSKEYEAR